MANIATTTQRPSLGQAVESALVRGDLSQLSTSERLAYMRSVCESLGLNPLTGPFEFITLDGKLRLYARKDCTEQLRRIHHVSLKIVARELVGDVFMVHVRATMPAGKGKRSDEDVGCVSMTNLKKGDTPANAIMRAITKAKRRVTLSICGLGFMDESEVESVTVESSTVQPQQHPVPASPPAIAAAPPVQPPAQAPPPRAGFATDVQLAEMLALKRELALSDAMWRGSMELRGVQSARDLSEAQAAEVLATLRTKRHTPGGDGLPANGTAAATNGQGGSAAQTAPAFPGR